MSSKKDKSGPFATGFANWKTVTTTLHNRRPRERVSMVPGVEPLLNLDPSQPPPEGVTPEQFRATIEHLAKQEEDLGSLPPRVYSSMVECQDRVFVLGGTDLTGQPLNTMFSAEEPLSDWYDMPPFKAAKAGMCTHTVGSKIFILGGSNVKQEGDNAVEIFDVNTETWTQGSKMPGDNFTGCRSVYHNGLIYVIGGIKDSDSCCMNTIMTYDPERDNWSIRGFPELKFHRYASTLTIKNNRLYVSGGREGKLPCDGLEVYSFDDNQVKLLPPCPAKKVFYQEFNRPQDPDFYLLGGMDYPTTTPNASNLMHRFDLRANSWEQMPNMFTPRADFGTACFANKLFAIGGVTINARTQVEPTNHIEVFSPEDRSWAKFKNTMPTPRFAPHVLEYKHKLYVYGGFSVQKICGSLEKLEIKVN